MSHFLLDEIRQAAEVKFGSTDIEFGEATVRLLNPLRLPETKRTELQAIQRRMDDDAELDQIGLLRDAVRCVAETKGGAAALLREVGDDMALLAMIFERYVEGSQAGEASPSPS
jgi:hypothetical protein